MTVELFFVITIIFSLSGIVKGWSGFGTNLLAIPMLTLFLGYDRISAVTITLSINVILNIAILIENKKFKLSTLLAIKQMVIFGIVFTIVGFVILDSANDQVFKIIVGSIMVLTVINKVVDPSFVILHKEKYYIPTGIISGILNGIAGLGGIPAMLLLSHSNMDKDQFRSTLVTYFLIMNIFALLINFFNGSFTSFVVSNILVLLIPSVLFTMIGIYLSRKASDKVFQYGVLIVMLLMGSYMIFDGIQNML